MAQPGMAAYMMEAEGRAIAMAMAHAVLDQADILTIAVHPSMRGQGLGRALMQTLERALAALGVTQVFLEVRASNKPAMLLYESLGYQRIATRPNYYGGSEDGLLMKKEMHPAA
jgi:ribosomal-protein-alanine N-acetyltransferase